MSNEKTFLMVMTSQTYKKNNLQGENESKQPWRLYCQRHQKGM
jgi:hypothetical protein